MVVAVHECEGGVSRFELDLQAGRISCSPSEKSADFECADVTWAGIACGDLKASDAVRFGLAVSPQMPMLDVLAQGPQPFTHEYF